MPRIFQELLKGQQTRLITYDALGNKYADMENAIFTLSWATSNADCDLSAILCDREGKIITGGRSEYIIYFKNLHHSSDSILHLTDATAGTSDLDEEQIMLALKAIPGEVETVQIVANVYSGQQFNRLSNVVFRILDPARVLKYDGLEERYEVARYNISSDRYSTNGLIIGELFRNWFEPKSNQDAWEYEWRFRIIGTGVSGANRLNKIVDLYR